MQSAEHALCTLLCNLILVLLCRSFLSCCNTFFFVYLPLLPVVPFRTISCRLLRAAYTPHLSPVVLSGSFYSTRASALTVVPPHTAAVHVVVHGSVLCAPRSSRERSVGSPILQSSTTLPLNPFELCIETLRGLLKCQGADVKRG